MGIRGVGGVTGAAFKEWRDGNGLSLTQCAKLLQVSRATILRWQKRGPSPMAARVIKGLPRLGVLG